MSTARRDVLLAIEKCAQEQWEKQHIHEFNAPAPGEPCPPKYLTTFPFPYMNGLLHLGHAFSLTKAEFTSRYHRMKGCRSLWPFGFHVTGTPIAACAQKIANEIEYYGNPPVFTEQPEETKKVGANLDITKHRSKRGKISTSKLQWTIMQSQGIPDNEIPNFKDPQFWLEYFPPRAIESLRRFGCHIDFRRSFITTTHNPYFDRFVTWQFHKLRESGFLSFGKRHCVYSPWDKQPCADHDRASGEGALPQEYTLLKLQVQKPMEQPALAVFKDIIDDRKVVFPAATLRPETVVGQTNCWVSPSIDYKAYGIQNRKGEEEIFIMTARAARNMAYQDFVINGNTWEEPQALFEINGAKLIGIPLSAPLAPYGTIYTLPMSTITESKGTGVVTSEPCDSPDDYVNLMQLMNKPDYRAKLGLKDEWVVPFKPVPIIEIPTIGVECAKHICENKNITGPKAKELLEEAKHVCYQMGFYQGIMVAGPFTGCKVSEAKMLTQRYMEEKDLCMTYYEPVQQVISRSGDECVVALCDQWYIEYGQEEWKQAVVNHVSNMNMYSPGVHNAFVEVLNWLSEWPCSRTFGLGTYLPTDATHTMIIDSLSDSTIYMAYYTISRFFHVSADGTLFLCGAPDNAYGLKPEMFTDAVFDYIFHAKGKAKDVAAAVGMSHETLELMRNEFAYFYPVDIRCSGKDLIQNHLTMFLYNHAAIWPEEEGMWPRSIYCNGHVLIDNEKMAKSKGNFITLSEAIDTYGADATRLACADAGDTLDDANFVRDTASNFILKLTTMLEQAKSMCQCKELRTGEYNEFDKIFINTINDIIIRTEQFYENMQFRMVLNTSFHEFTKEFSQYKLNCGATMMHVKTSQRYLEVLTLLLMPLAPHFAEHMWQCVLKKDGSVVTQLFPVPTAPLDYSLIVSNRVMMDVLKEIRAQVSKHKKVQNSLIIYTLSEYAEWQCKALGVLQGIYEKNKKSFPPDTTKQIISLKPEWLSKDLIPDTMAFISFVRANVEKYGEQAMILKPTINDYDFLTKIKDKLSNLSGVDAIEIRSATEKTYSQHAAAQRKCRPSEPTVAFIPMTHDATKP